MLYTLLALLPVNGNLFFILCYRSIMFTQDGWACASTLQRATEIYIFFIPSSESNFLYMLYMLQISVPQICNLVVPSLLIHTEREVVSLFHSFNILGLPLSDECVIACFRDFFQIHVLYALMPVFHALAEFNGFYQSVGRALASTQVQSYLGSHYYQLLEKTHLQNVKLGTWSTHYHQGNVEVEITKAENIKNIYILFAIFTNEDMATVIVQEGITIILYVDEFLYITRTYEAALHLSGIIISST
ncbi:hypothetical protein ACJX0J_018444 [Zea mays]